MKLHTPEELVQDIRMGRMVILMDDEDRENEGDLVMAAQCVRPEDINFMATHGRGLICMPMSRARCKQLNLPLMVDRNASGFGTKFTVSIEASEGVTTGISAADRARTVQAAAAHHAKAEDIVQPGHIFPLMAEDGGVLVRAGHTEAACDLARMAGFEESGVICEIMKDDGSMARRPDLEKFAEQHDIKIGTIADLIHYRVLHDTTIEKIDQQPLESDLGDFELHSFRDLLTGEVHLAVVSGEIDADKPTLVRVQIASAVRDLMQAHAPGGSGWNMHKCLSEVAKHGGVVVLLAKPESPENILASLAFLQGKEPRVAKEGSDGVYMNIGRGSQILRELGAGKIRLMDKPTKFSAISGFDLEVVDFVEPEQLLQENGS